MESLSRTNASNEPDKRFISFCTLRSRSLRAQATIDEASLPLQGAKIRYMFGGKATVPMVPIMLA